MKTTYEYLSNLPPLDEFIWNSSNNSISNAITDKAASATFIVKPTPSTEMINAITNTVLKKANVKPLMPEVITTKLKKDKTLPDGTFKKGGLYTTVKWSDGTYTTVKASEGDECESSPYMAFCAALAKKLYGTNSAVHRIVNRHTAEYLESEQKKAAADKRAKEREAEQAAHEHALLREAKRLRLKEEAKAYNRAHKQDEE